MRAALLLLAACSGSQPPTADTGPPFEGWDREPCPSNAQRNLYWGDLHVHTALSFDAYVYDIRLGPNEAYAYARGEPVKTWPLDPEGNPTREVRIDRPLDFAAVTDHSEYLAEVRACSDTESAAYNTPICSTYRSEIAQSLQRWGLEFVPESPSRIEEICDEVDCVAGAADVWSEVIEAAEAHYDRTLACSFTTFVAYEWSATTGISNHHRNVIFRNEHVPASPISTFEEATAPGLWNRLQSECIDGMKDCDVLAIPHNSNQSNGALFPAEPSDEATARLRARMEPLLEIYQHKGDSECRNGIGMFAPDELCDFEKLREPPTDDCGEGTGSGGIAGGGCQSSRDFARGLLLAGLQLEAETGINPYPMGFVASTDSHSATPGAVDEATYEGHLGVAEGTVEARLAPPALTPKGQRDSPGGLTAIWAESNDRDALFDAMRRRETYGTSGPRIAVRMFGGDLPDGLCSDPDWLKKADFSGVPMGGELDGPARFVVNATKDPEGTNLQRIQIVKGWIDAGGEPRLEVFDVAGNDNGSVDLETCEPSSGGASQLCAEWTDPTFEDGQYAYWYARVVERPTCRWSWRDCLTLPEGERPEACTSETIPRTIQERAWTSPIRSAP